MDDFLKKRLDNYNKWLENGSIDYSSRIVPLKESLDDKQWVLPTEQVLEIIKSTDSIALTDCVCRRHYKRCRHPVNVCLLLGRHGQSFVDKGLARKIAFEEAAVVLKRANESGLVHLSLYRPDHRLYALCSCCSCCCHDLQLLLNFQQKHLIMHADHIAETDMDQCTNCGVCIDRCSFQARAWQGDEMVYNSRKCYGCGLCVTTCPAEATVMRQNTDRI